MHGLSFAAISDVALVLILLLPSLSTGKDGNNRKTYVVRYRSGDTTIPVTVVLDYKKQAEYVINMNTRAPSKSVTFYDFKQRSIAYKDMRNRECFIGRLTNESLQTETHVLQVLRNPVETNPKTLSLDASRPSLTPTEVRNIAGQKIAMFCRKMATWLLQTVIAYKRNRRQIDHQVERTYAHYGHEKHEYSQYGHETYKVTYNQPQSGRYHRRTKKTRVQRNRHVLKPDDIRPHDTIYTPIPNRNHEMSGQSYNRISQNGERSKHGRHQKENQSNAFTNNGHSRVYGRSDTHPLQALSYNGEGSYNGTSPYVLPLLRPFRPTEAKAADGHNNGIDVALKNSEILNSQLASHDVGGPQNAAQTPWDFSLHQTPHNQPDWRNSIPLRLPSLLDSERHHETYDKFTLPLRRGSPALLEQPTRDVEDTTGWTNQSTVQHNVLGNHTIQLRQGKLSYDLTNGRELESYPSDNEENVGRQHQNSNKEQLNYPYKQDENAREEKYSETNNNTSTNKETDAHNFELKFSSNITHSEYGVSKDNIGHPSSVAGKRDGSQRSDTPSEDFDLWYYLSNEHVLNSSDPRATEESNHSLPAVTQRNNIPLEQGRLQNVLQLFTPDEIVIDIGNIPNKPEYLSATSGNSYHSVDASMKHVNRTLYHDGGRTRQETGNAWIRPHRAEDGASAAHRSTDLARKRTPYAHHMKPDPGISSQIPQTALPPGISVYPRHHTSPFAEFASPSAKRPVMSPNIHRPHRQRHPHRKHRVKPFCCAGQLASQRCCSSQQRRRQPQPCCSSKKTTGTQWHAQTSSTPEAAQNVNQKATRSLSAEEVCQEKRMCRTLYESTQAVMVCRHPNVPGC